jgi:protein involved in ribonucleotide reduction
MIVFASRTGNVRYMIGKLGLPSAEITEDLVIHRPYLLFTYTDGLGEIPLRVDTFLNVKENQDNLKGIIVTGNINFGDLFCKAADLINQKYNVPIIRKIDLRGTDQDVLEIRKQYYNYIKGEEY